ncbi:3-oxoacyl-[acyl-carrier-protein] synthase III C-terminal domain-containing protein [Patescibacteria group bacterium]
MNRITRIQTWLPPYHYSQEELLGEFGLNAHRSARVIFRRARIASRNFIIPARTLVTPNASEKIFPPLCEILPDAPSVDHVVEVSDLGSMYRRGGASHVHHHWCPGSIRALEESSTLSGRTLIVSCDLRSYLRWKPDFNNSSDVVTYSLMGDAIAAVVVEQSQQSSEAHPAILGCAYRSKACGLVGTADGKLFLDPQLPSHIPPLVHGCLDDLFERFSISQDDISFWIVHPGGVRILDEMEKSFGLGEQTLEFSRQVLRDYGNIGGSSIFFILDLVQRTQPQAGSYAIAISFGPGMEPNELLAATCLLQW